MYKVLFLLLVTSIFCISKDEIDPFIQFQDFLKKYNKIYPTLEEFNHRYQIFKEKLQRESISKGRWIEGVTKFSDLTPEEFKSIYLNYKPPQKVLSSSPKREVIKRGDAPENFSWIEEGALGEVKDQGYCGACYAFSACGALEGAYYVKHGIRGSCSEQNLVDCDDLDGGCNGGHMSSAFNFIKKNGGIQRDDDYPYEKEAKFCRQNPFKFEIRVTDSWMGSYPDEEKLKNDLYNIGPLAVGFNSKGLDSYIAGIIDVEDCDPEGRDHGVTLVGYGVEYGKKYWIVRNSWGSNWGEKGYFRVARGKGMCGINVDINIPYVE